MEGNNGNTYIIDRPVSISNILNIYIIIASILYISKK